MAITVANAVLLEMKHLHWQTLDSPSGVAIIGLLLIRVDYGPSRTMVAMRVYFLACPAVREGVVDLNAAKKPRVLVYKSSLLPYSETFIKEQMRHLMKWDAILLGQKVLRPGLDLSDVEVVELNASRPFWSRWLHRAFKLLWWADPRNCRAVKALKPDLLHAHFGPEGVAIWPLAKALNIPLLVTLHGYDITTHRAHWEQSSSRIKRLYPERMLTMAREPGVHFIAVSEAIRQKALAYGIPADKISVSYIGVDTDRFVPGNTPLSNRQQVLFVGRLVEKKGCQYLVEAFANIQEQYPEAELVIVGTGPQEAMLKELVSQRRVRARFLGVLDSRQVQQQLDLSRVFCLPSITAENGNAEGLGIVILEAQACGVPAITSAHGGATEGIVDGVTGFAHGEKDVAAIEQALVRLLADDELANEMGRRAREHMLQNMDLKECSRKLEAIYDWHAGALGSRS